MLGIYRGKEYRSDAGWNGWMAERQDFPGQFSVDHSQSLLPGCNTMPFGLQMNQSAKLHSIASSLFVCLRFAAMMKNAKWEEELNYH